MAKLVYISGKMGEKKLSKATKEKFYKAQEKLLDDGYAVLNPGNDAWQKELHHHVKIEEKKWQELDHGAFDWYAWALLWDMHNLALADAIYLLRDWQDSPGAKAEYAFAKACNKEIMFEDETTKPQDL